MKFVTKSVSDRIETVARSARDEGHVRIMVPLVSFGSLNLRCEFARLTSWSSRLEGDHRSTD